MSRWRNSIGRPAATCSILTLEEFSSKFMTTMTAQETEELLEQVEETVSHRDTIETVIASMAEEGTAMVNQAKTGWKFRYGTVDVAVSMTGEDPTDTFTVVATVMSLPVQNEPELFRYLLEKNATDTFEARFAIEADQVIVVSSRSVEDLSAAEISRIITIVATIADEYDEELKEKFPPLNPSA
ncbi:MAG: YbjN domain-containing protein [Pseudanabaenaceae cyanobacterium SKYGB_i_bin29]|nr:YbjN domain-containing protein [Pseudanabaenaceae cyanobacterium SKYG29]MDW8420589.1 YbjN domain-containing protein [Pseudanabaenaceae cyanobacterium SKYGB_i_bin29]